MSDSKIKSIKAREILNSRGNPTVEVELVTNCGEVKASVPSGASTGKYEAVELRDGGRRYGGKGVLKAVKNINKIIAPKLKGKEVSDQGEIDSLLLKLDGTKNKLKLGANAILPVSMAVCRAGAYEKDIYLWKYIAKICKNRKVKMPEPCLNVINGGAHAGNDLDFQEFMICPQMKPFSKSLQSASEIYFELKKIIRKQCGESAINVGDEGGFAPLLGKPEEAMDLLLSAIEKTGYKNKVKIILDVAASQFYKDKRYKLNFNTFDAEQLFAYYFDLIQKYPILGIEDAFEEDDWSAFQLINQNLGKKIMVIGDDLLVTNPLRIKKAEEKKACNALLLKVNQIGTITEAIEAGLLAKSYGWKLIVSHRSGETKDDFIADLAVGIGAEYVKFGAPARGERVAKYNRLLAIEKEIG